MKNKFPFVILLFLLLVFTSMSGVFAKDIVYIAKDSNSVDSSIIDLIEAKNYSYDIVYKTNITATNFSDYRVLIVGEGNFGSDSKEIPVNQMSSVILNKNHLEDWNWMEGGVSLLSFNQPSKAVIFEDDSPVVLNLFNKTFSVYEYSQNNIISYEIYYISKLKQANGINTVVADDLTSQIFGGNPKKGAVVATVNKNSQLLNNNLSNSRGVFIGFTDSYLWTNDSKNIFYNSIDWVKKGDDFDKDGFFGDFDCNDENPNINPNATEIPYDGIDQDCSGFDLADVDEDGFDSEIVGGNDCNDNDSNYNINSTDVTMNCVNDAPVIFDINKIYVYEGENASFYVYSNDPEEDSVSYYINDSRFIQNENYFSWQTNHTDSGDYDFFVFANDSLGKISQKSFEVKVWNRNKAPELIQEIPEQNWSEDNNHTLNLSEYFYDIDGDILFYFFHNSSEDLNIKLEKIVEGIVYFDSEENWFGQDWIIFKVADGINTAYTNKIVLNVLPVNDAPLLIKKVENLSFDEDTSYLINLSEHFLDIDNSLNYDIKDNENFSFEIYNETLRIIPNENWFGNENFDLIASDLEYNVSTNVNLEVLPVNDAPTINSLEDILVLGGNLVEIDINATDVENDSLNYFVDDSRFIQNENYFSWQTSEDDFGIYSFDFSVSDSFETVSKEVKVTILQKIFINEIEVGENGWIEIYNPKNQDFNLSGCFINNSNNDILDLFGEIGYGDFVVFDWDMLDEDGLIDFYCSDNLIDSLNYENLNEGDSYGRENDSGDFIVFEFPTKGLTNNADMISPVLEVYSPLDNSFFNETREIEFEFKVSDNLEENLDCSLFIDGEKRKTISALNGTLSNFETSLVDGNYLWTIECSDSLNKVSSESFSFEVSAPDNPVLGFIGSKQVNENEILDFIVSATDADGEELIFDVENKPEGAEFADNKDGTATFSWIPNYQQSGTYFIKFIVEDEKGLKDSEEIQVEVNNMKEPPKFSDSQICELKNDLIEIDIREPDKNDEFELGEIIEGEIKLENDFEEDLDFDYEIYLYDISEEESIEDLEDDIEVDEGDSEKIDFEFEIPEDIEDNDFVIYVYVEDEEERCNSEFVDIDIERKEHDVRIKEINFIPELVSPGDNLEVLVEIENLGSEEEDVYIKLENDELGILEKSEEFEIEEYGEDDEETESFYVIIPKDALEKDYELKATVVFDDGEDSKTETFGILERAKSLISEEDIIPEDIIYLENSGFSLGEISSSEKIKSEKQPEVNINFKESKTKSEGNNLMPVFILLIVGIVILFILILVFVL